MYGKADISALPGTNRNHVKCLRISVNIAEKREVRSLLMFGVYSPFSKSR